MAWNSCSTHILSYTFSPGERTDGRWRIGGGCARRQPADWSSGRRPRISQLEWDVRSAHTRRESVIWPARLSSRYYLRRLRALGPRCPHINFCDPLCRTRLHLFFYLVARRELDFFPFFSWTTALPLLLPSRGRINIEHGNRVRDYFVWNLHTYVHTESTKIRNGEEGLAGCLASIRSLLS